MIDQKDVALQLAKFFLEIKAIKINVRQPFTWASGWKSPIYTDHRILLSYPEIRAFVREKLAHTIQQNFIDVDLIAGVATGAIAHGALAADKLRLPFCYIRSSSKTHGTGQLIEGKAEPGQNAIVVEDLISTGGSSLKAVNALKDSGVNVVGMVALFSYQFPQAEEAFEKEGLTVYTLSNYQTLLEAAKSSGDINPNDMSTLEEWRKDPAGWMAEA